RDALEVINGLIALRHVREVLAIEQDLERFCRIAASGRGSRHEGGHAHRKSKHRQSSTKHRRFPLRVLLFTAHAGDGLSYFFQTRNRAAFRKMSIKMRD